MGAYLSTPQRRKDSADGANNNVKFGVSRMQGWKRIQEVKCNYSVDFEEKHGLSLFTMFEGFRGPEVAEYCAQHFPEYLRLFLKEKQFIESKLDEHLAEAFVCFDESLRDDMVSEILMGIREQHQSSVKSKPASHSKSVPNASRNESDYSDDDDDDEDANLLLEEACMPMEELMERYEGGSGNDITTNDNTLHCNDNANYKDSAILENSIKATVASAETVLSNPSIESNSATSNGVNGSSFSENISDKVSNVDQSSNVTSEAPDTTSLSNYGIKQCEILSQHESDSTVLEGEQTPTTIEYQTSASSTPVPETSIASSICRIADSSVSCQVQNMVKSSTQCAADSTNGLSKDRQVDLLRNGSGSSADRFSCSVDAGPSSSSGYKKLHNRVIDNDSESDSDDSVDRWCSDDVTDDEDDSDDVSSDAEEDNENGENGLRENRDQIVRCGYDTGCSALAVLLHSDSTDPCRRELYVAGAGMSRCIMCRAGKAVDLAGGRYVGAEEEEDQLNTHHSLPAKALGYHSYKGDIGLITPSPDIISLPLCKDDEFVVIASEGVWKVLGSQDIVSFVKNHLSCGVDNYSTICEQMLDTCLAPNLKSPVGCDNMAVVIISLTSHSSSAQSLSSTSTTFHEISLNKKRSITDDEEELHADNEVAETKRLKLDDS